MRGCRAEPAPAPDPGLPWPASALHLLCVVPAQSEISLVSSVFSTVCTVLCNGKRPRVLLEIRTYIKTAIITTAKQGSEAGERGFPQGAWLGEAACHRGFKGELLEMGFVVGACPRVGEKTVTVTQKRARITQGCSRTGVENRRKERAFPREGDGNWHPWEP